MTADNGDGSHDDPWLPIGAAARLVGVGPDTLRRWADGGKVQSYQTPGGHRRFLRSSLETMINAPRRHRYGTEMRMTLPAASNRRAKPAASGTCSRTWRHSTRS